MGIQILVFQKHPESYAVLRRKIREESPGAEKKILFFDEKTEERWSDDASEQLETALSSSDQLVIVSGQVFGTPLLGQTEGLDLAVAIKKDDLDRKSTRLNSSH